MNINYKSDFDFILEINTCIKQDDGTCLKTPLGWPTFDWIATFWTNNKANTYTASRHGDQLVNCFNDNGHIHIVVNHHHLGPGTLNIEFHALHPAAIYPDHIRDAYDPQPLNIELVPGPGDCATSIQAELLLPMLKGEPFTYEDFTPEQIAELKRPATEAARLADQATEEANKAAERAEDAASAITETEKEMAEAEAKRAEAEGVRVTNEEARIANENTRISAEKGRTSAETGRDKAENERVANEAVRKKDEAQRQSNETTRSSAESVREDAEAVRVANESTRETHETQRVQNEQARVTAEDTRVTAESARVTEFNTLKSESQTATSRANEAAQAANSAVENLEEALSGKEDAFSLSKDLQMSEERELSVSERAKMQVFIDIWNSRCNFGGNLIVGKYDPENAPDAEHQFTVNKLWFTYKEAIDVYNASQPKHSVNPINYDHTYPKVKTVIPSMNYGNSSYSFGYCNLVNISFIDGYSSGIYQGVGASFSFYGCQSLQRILNPLVFTGNVGNNNFINCKSLYELRLNLSNANCKSIDLRYVAKWSLESVQYTVTKKTSSVAVSIIVHPDVYAKLTGDTTNAAAAALSEEELAQWMALVPQALSKNISFATV